jgi:hypothetical protein
MGRLPLEKERGFPDKLVARLVSRLKRHLLWDSLLIFFPPLLVLFYAGAFLYRAALIPQEALILAAAIGVGVAWLMGTLRYRPMAPTARFAARLIDDRVQGKDRFVTLATIDPPAFASFLVARLRREAAGLVHRIDLKKDFRFRFKRSFFASLIGSLLSILLFHLIVQIGPYLAPQELPGRELELIARELSRVPRFSELARSLEALAVRLREQGPSNVERSLIQNALAQVEAQLTAEREQRGSHSDLLSRAADALRGLGRGDQDGQEKGADGGLKSNFPEDGGDGRKTARAGQGEGQTDVTLSGRKDAKAGKSAPGEAEEAGKEQGIGERQGKKEREKKNEMGGMAKGGLEQRGGKSRGEEIPRGATPDRYLQPGEQAEKRVKGARFVTVQLPEEEAAGSMGEASSGKRRKLRPKVPVSNVPLRPADSPEAAAEKQPLPLEYRGLIR